jgi:hypothetical protein
VQILARATVFGVATVIQESHLVSCCVVLSGTYPSSKSHSDSPAQSQRPVGAVRAKTKRFAIAAAVVCTKNESKTFNSGYSLVVTHLTTNPPVHCLNRAERTGSLALNVLWSNVKRCLIKIFILLYSIYSGAIDVTSSPPEVVATAAAHAESFHTQSASHKYIDIIQRCRATKQPRIPQTEFVCAASTRHCVN